MSTKDIAVKTTELVINALTYAHDHKLNINNVNDVQKILKALNQEDSKTHAEAFMGMMNVVSNMIERDVERRRKHN